MTDPLQCVWPGKLIEFTRQHDLTNGLEHPVHFLVVLDSGKCVEVETSDYDIQVDWYETVECWLANNWGFKWKSDLVREATGVE